MRKYKTETITEERLSLIICNKCGKQTTPDEYGIPADYMEEIHINPGYGSKMDGAAIKLDLCDECLVDFITGLKIWPEVFSYEDILGKIERE